MSVPKRMRFEIFRRDGFRCRYCGATPEQAQLRPDHVIPEALGGKTEPANLVTACDDCNSGKSSIVLLGTVADVAEETAAATSIPVFAADLWNVVSDHLGDDYLIPIVQQLHTDGIPPSHQLEEGARRLVAQMAAALSTRVTAALSKALDQCDALPDWEYDRIVLEVRAVAEAMR